MTQYWLLKAEPDSRIVKGKDVKFSVDDFERTGVSSWDGVRNYQARNFMKAMKKSDKALFYHSNCKTPGIAAYAEVAKEAYPDHTAWDSSHPYFDAGSDSANPRWFMVDLAFESRTLPPELEYIGLDGVSAIKKMDVVSAKRLSVQPVQPDAWKAIQLLAENGGWDELDFFPKNKKKKAKSTESETEKDVSGKTKDSGGPRSGQKRKAGGSAVDEPSPRRSSRKK